MSEISIPQVWQEWVDSNLDRGVDEELIVKIMQEDGKFLPQESRKYVEKSLEERCRYRDFILKVRSDFNDTVQNELNMQYLRQFLDEECKFSPSKKIINRLQTQWLALDETSTDFEIRARKFAFFHALDYLILAYGYDFPYPNPLHFKFFPCVDSAVTIEDSLFAEDLQSYKEAFSSSKKLRPIAKINGENLYLVKSKEDKNIYLGSGIHGKVFEGFFRKKAVAIKFLALDKFSTSLAWQKILVSYRQSKVVLERNYKNVLPMNEVFFLQEEVLFEGHTRTGLVAIYPLCQKTFYDYAVEQPMVFSGYESLQWVKEILQTLANLHKDGIAVHDFVAQNIMFDFDGNALLHDFDYWLPLNMTDLKSAYTQKNVIGSGYFSLQEIEFMIDRDVKKIIPEKIDVWCFAMILLVGRGYLTKVESLRRSTVDMLVKFSNNASHNSPALVQEAKEIEVKILNFIESALQKVSEEIVASSNELEKNFLVDLLQVLKNCLLHDVNERWSVADVLDSPLFKKVKTL